MIKPAALSVIACALALLLECAPAGADVTVFAHASVITMEHDAPLDDHSVVVRDGRIEWVGPAIDAPIDEDATVVDCTGRYLMPGLADMHVHTWQPHELSLFVAWGVTTVRNMWGTPIQQAMQRRVERGAVVGPAIHTTGAIIDGVPPVWPRSIGVADEQQARDAVRAQHNLGFSMIKVYSRLSPEAFRGACEEALALDMRIAGHVPMHVPLADAFDAGMECVEHLTGYIRAAQGDASPVRSLTPEELDRIPRGEERRVLLEHVDAKALHAAARLTKDKGVWNTPTLIVLERSGASPAQRRAFYDSEHMRYVSSFSRGMWPPAPVEGNAPLRDTREPMVQRFDEVNRDIVRALHEAGCDLLAGTDTPNPFVWTGYSIHEELRLLVSCGLSPVEALRCATTNAARYLHETDEFGRVAPGLRADLLLLEANPLEDISATERIRGVMVRGRWLDRAALDGMLERVATELAR